MGDLASEYGNEIRLWLEELKELDAQDDVEGAAAGGGFGGRETPVHQVFREDVEAADARRKTTVD